MNRCKLSANLADHFEIFKICVNPVLFKDLEFNKIIYKKDRTYVFKVDISNKPYELVIKVARESFREYEKEQVKYDMKKEVNYGIEMGEQNIGPKIYDYFYVETKSKGVKYINQYIIMESMSMDATDALAHDKISDKCKIKIIDKMISLLVKQIEYGLYCTDIKPDNYAVNIKNGKITSVKMIDFSGTHCSRKRTERASKKNNIVLLIFQILLFVFLDTEKVFKIYSRTNKFKHFIKFFKSNMEELLYMASSDSSSEIRHYFSKREVKQGMYAMGLL